MRHEFGCLIDLFCQFFCIGQGLFYIANGSPVELLLLFVFELHLRIDVEVAQRRQIDGVARFLVDGNARHITHFVGARPASRLRHGKLACHDKGQYDE